MRAPWPLAIALALGACVQTQEMALAPNVVRLDTQASGLLSMGQAGPQTTRRAAELTLQHGYTYFRLQDAQMGSGRDLVGVYSATNGSVDVSSPYNASYQGNGLSSGVYRHRENVGVTVVMFHEGEPGAKGAFDARQVLAESAH